VYEGGSGAWAYGLSMDMLLIVASLVSFLVLVVGWVVLPHSAQIRPAVASTSEAAPQPAATAA